MQLEAAKILRRCRIGRATEEGCESLDVSNIIVARLLDEVAHGHVFDHAPAQRADGLLVHRGLPVLRWRCIHPSILKTGPQPVIASRLPRHSIGATGSTSRAARSREAGSFPGTEPPFAAMQKTWPVLRYCGHRPVDP